MLADPSGGPGSPDREIGPQWGGQVRDAPHPMRVAVAERSPGHKASDITRLALAPVVKARSFRTPIPTAGAARALREEHERKNDSKQPAASRDRIGAEPFGPRRKRLSQFEERRFPTHRP
jgi:hypothetical protein